MTRTPSTSRRASIGPAVLGLVVLLCSCGGAQQSQAPAPTTPNAPAFSDEAPAASAAPTGGVHAVPGQPSLSPPPPPPPPPSPADQPTERGAARIAAGAELDRAQRDLELAASDCESACRALASMERATSHLCSLAEEPDDQRRCDDARLRLSAARGRVRAACGGCR
jgi:type IV secretory pathway VirB10-like protein